MTDQINELCHHLLNGVQVIKGLCAEGKVGKLSPWDVFDKIEHRAKGLEQAFKAIKERRELSTSNVERPTLNDEHQAGTPFDCLKTGPSNVQPSSAEAMADRRSTSNEVGNE